ncbi:glycoside hydrolase family 3 N-terminal domain-containing protein [Bacteroides sp. GM023]|uniref:glycoside hydrolase family 3 N-terminal domain-containing protein n=1 Tax=Bacteroides sp. GM023 TaxID=2723058 RepID=UPI00168B4C0C|nr:glycoside hydrolase family 3 N-terminal domain-containing protein [Bacteroides sp. GM023]MBD3589033.1 glycosyl hydrolase [Bacteroides sp. GM023]
MNTLKKATVYGLAALSLLACKPGQDATEQKIDALLSKMTLKEKIGQMNQLTGLGLAEDMQGAIRNGDVGSILNELDLATTNKLQHIAVEESRLGIPLIFARDVIHGFKTIFPIPLGQAASWNPKIAENGARVAALEASSVGIRWTFAPMIDISRDPRWGRIAESCGEDPYLTSVMGNAMIKGFQGDTLSSPTSIAACAKHFAAYGASESGKDYNTTWIPEIQLRELYLPPFKAAVDAGAATFMCSFNDINGVPSSGSTFLNRQILRDEWKYDGLLVSDWGSIQQMIPHGFCADLKEAGEKAAIAGVDMDMMSYAYINHLEELIKEKKVDEKLIDESVRNILRLKFRLGLFDNPYIKEGAPSAFYLNSSLQQAKEAAIESAILLKNELQVLPLTSSVKSVAVVGPLADAPADQVGTWCFDAEPEHSVTPLTAIQQECENKIRVIAEPGLTYSRDKSEAGIAKAVAAARQADVILFFAGEEAVLSGEARCRADISLPGKQTEMLKALKATEKPVVLVIMAGRPLTIPEEVEMADAVLYNFHGGTMAGPAISDLLFGKAVPSGKLPVTLPRMVGQVPIYYAHKNTGRPASNITLIDDIEVGAKQTSIGFTSYHLDAGDGPLFPFGYGLSYTTFTYGDCQLSTGNMKPGDVLTASCDITNSGAYDAQEVVQLYIRDKVGSLVRPVKELKGFKKIMIKAGDTVRVNFTLTTDELAYWNADMQQRAEAGEFTVWIAPDSQSGEGTDFKLTN